MNQVMLARGIAMTLSVLSSALIAPRSVLADTKQASNIFDVWVNQKSSFFHHEFEDVALAMPKKLQVHIQKKITDGPVAFNPFKSFFSLLARQYWLTDTNTVIYNKYFKDAIKKIYPLLDHDTAGFLKLLKQNGMATEAINVSEAKASFQKVIDKYNDFADVFCVESGGDDTTTHFALANRFFEFCYGPSTWPQFKKMLHSSVDYPLIRLLHSVLWYNLAGDGWKNWHKATLDALKREHDKGKEIVYIAGGCDIYNLLRNGIYRIRVIDPMLPTQPRYYIDDWQWFVGMDIGDTLEYDFGGKKLTMKRSDVYENFGLMKVKDLKGKPCTIKESVVTWTLYDDTNKECGSVVFDRRYARQDDFKITDKQALLISFNELYYVITTGDDHWGIDLNLIPDTATLFVKQLRKPVDKKIMENMRFTDGSAYQFIKLGTAVREP